jgi:hypothetical protein
MWSVCIIVRRQMEFAADEDVRGADGRAGRFCSNRLCHNAVSAGLDHDESRECDPAILANMFWESIFKNHRFTRPPYGERKNRWDMSLRNSL